MERPKRKEDLIDKSSAFIRSRTKETIALGTAGIGISILGEKIDNDILSESGTVSAALAYALITFSWGKLWVNEAIDDAIELISKQIQKRKNNKNS